MEIPTRNGLAPCTRRCLHAGRNLTKATVVLAESDGRPIAVKDFAARPWPVRRILGPLQLDREARAYRLLRDLPGVPRLLGRIDQMAIALEYVPGGDLGSACPGDLPPAFFDRLERLLEAFHGRGVAHGDLHRRDVLVGPDGEPFIVDFSTSLVVRASSGALRRFVFDQMRRADQRAVAGMRRRLLPGSSREIPKAPALYRVGRRLKTCFDRLRGRRVPRAREDR